jgi:hypothetical protein
MSVRNHIATGLGVEKVYDERAENVPVAEAEAERREQHIGAPTEGRIEPASEEVILASAQHRMAFNPGTVERMERIAAKSGLQKVTGAINIGPIVKLGPRAA